MLLAHCMRITAEQSHIRLSTAEILKRQRPGVASAWGHCRADF